MSEMEKGVGILSRKFIRAFFKYVEKVEVAKKQLHMKVRMGETLGDTNLSIGSEIASLPVLLVLSFFLLIAFLH